MKKFLLKLIEKLSNTTIKNQLNRIYIIALLIPILAIGSFLLINTNKLLTNYHNDIIEANNARIRTVMFELTSLIYNISETIALDKDLQATLSSDFKSSDDFKKFLRNYSVINNYINNYTEIDDISIYVDSDYIENYEHFGSVTEDIINEEWYQRARNQFGAFWYPITDVDKYGTVYWNLALVRKIPLITTNADAVLVITISDQFIKSRLNSSDYLTFISIDDKSVFFSSDWKLYGTKQPVEIDFSVEPYHYFGVTDFQGVRYMSYVGSLKLYQTDSLLYITTLNDEAYRNTQKILLGSLLIILTALVLPGLMIRYYTSFFTSRVNTLREEMHKASHEEYDLKEVIRGEDEISQAFADLKIMVQLIKEKDSIMYEAMLKEKNLINEQQVMEFKMLSSQINPHFLYNTLESIRMKAVMEGNKEVATSIKLLGKSMRYVLENTGTSSTTLFNELDYIQTYLMIQKMRFSEKVQYELEIEDGLVLGNYQILPLLLQPIVENAFIHGLANVEKNGLIRIEVKHINDEILLISIFDNGCGMDEATLTRLREKIQITNKDLKSSIGLYNIHQRIRLYYGEEYGIHIDSNIGEGTKVTLTLPLIDIEEI